MGEHRTSKYSERVVERFKRAFDTSRLESIEQWRERFAAVAMLVVLLALPAAMFVAVPALLRGGHWYLVVLDAAVWLWSLISALQPEKPTHGRTIMAVLYAMLVSFLLALGPGDARPAWLVAVPVMASLLFGARAAIICLGVNVGLLLLCYFLLGHSLEGWQWVYAVPPERWWLLVVSTTMLTLVVSLPIGFLLDGVTTVLNKERDLRALLLREHADLERAHRDLLDGVARREQLEHDLRQAQKLEALGTVAGGVAHDLNNFLTPVLLYAEMVRARLPASSVERRYLDHMLTAVEHARELVARVLAFSRKVPVPDAYVELRELVNELAPGLRQQLPENVTLELALDDNCGSVFANRVTLVQIITNLVSNAIAAMPMGGALTIRLTQRVGLEADGVENIAGFAVLTVSDTGLGMDENTAQRMFEPFFTTKKMGEGTGLGLATVHGIVTSLGGRIHCETAPGQGTTFTVELPTRRAQAEAYAENSDRPPKTSQRLTGRVLLVDDDEAARLALLRTLEELGLNVESASNASSAMDLLVHGSPPFDLLLTDNQMPQSTGLDMLSTLRQKGFHIPAMLITGFPDNDVLRRAGELEVATVLPKPFTHGELTRALGKFLDAKEYDRANGADCHVPNE